MSKHCQRALYPAYLLFSFLFLSTVLLPTSLRAELVDRIVAVVNDDVITLSDIEAEGSELFHKIIATAPPQEVDDKLADARAQLLDSLIDKKLISQKAAALKITVSDAEVDAAFADILARNRINREQLLQKLAESGITEKHYKTTLESQILQNKLVGTDVHSKIIITDESVRRYYDENYTQTLESGAFYLLQMGFSWTNSDDGDIGQAAEYANQLEAEKRAKRVHRLAQAGQDFATLARKFSDLPSKVDGGDIGTFTLEEMAPYMRDAVASLNPGEISEIIETPVGYQFFKLLSVGNGNVVRTVPYDSVKDEIKQKLYEKELEKAYLQWVRNLKDEAYIQKL